MNYENKKKILQNITGQLAEHFQNVKIFVSTTENGDTYGLDSSRGSYYANKGQMLEYINQSNQLEREEAISNFYFENGNQILDDEDEDGEESSNI